jgi:hypothetical protein
MPYEEPLSKNLTMIVHYNELFLIVFSGSAQIKACILIVCVKILDIIPISGMMPF